MLMLYALVTCIRAAVSVRAHQCGSVGVYDNMYGDMTIDYVHTGGAMLYRVSIIHAMVLNTCSLAPSILS